MNHDDDLFAAAFVSSDPTAERLASVLVRGRRMLSLVTLGFLGLPVAGCVRHIVRGGSVWETLSALSVPAGFFLYIWLGSVWAARLWIGVVVVASVALIVGVDADVSRAVQIARGGLAAWLLVWGLVMATSTSLWAYVRSR